MDSSTVKYLRYEEFYTTTQIAIILDCDKSNVSKVLNGKIGKTVKPSFEKMTEKELERKQAIDKIIGLKHIYLIQDGEQLRYYAMLLCHLGFTKEELRSIFNYKSSLWLTNVWRKGDWRLFDITTLGIEENLLKF